MIQGSTTFHTRRVKTRKFIGRVKLLTQAGSAREKTLVEVFVIDANRLDKGRVHADDSLPKPGSETEKRSNTRLIFLVNKEVR